MKKNKKSIILTDGKKYVGTKTDGDVTEIVLVDSALDAFDYNSLVFKLKKKNIIKNAEEKLGVKLQPRNFVIVRKPEFYIITDGKFYIKKKELVINKDTDVNSLTLEQFNVIGGLPRTEDKDVMVRYYGIVEHECEALTFKKEKEANKALKVVQNMYGADFKVVKI